ncbi:MAG: hypothetical protein IAE97_04850 [Chthoniobacterales bacterium]|nr:hypothetical protein [Chthoniobacterales bacterium]
MKLSTFKAALARNPDQNLAIQLPCGDRIPAHFHITEVGRTEKRFVDCGGKTRTLASASLQIWVADDTDHRLSAGKLAAIIESNTRILGDDDPEMQVELQEGTIGLFTVAGSASADGTLVFTLANKHTACLALEVCVPDPRGEESCCGGERLDCVRST